MSILSTIAGVAIAILTAGPLGPDADVERLSPIRVLTHSHEVEFPDQVVFSLEAESDSPITEVQFFYRLADRNIQTYGYPEFSSDRRVSAEFSIKTGGSSYVPTGVDIEYFYRITDAAGNTLETEHFTFEYRDPRYTWSEVRRGDLVVLSHNLSRERVERMAEEVAQGLAEVKDLFGLEEISPIKAVIVNGRREAQRVFPYTSDTADRLRLFAGFAFGDYRLFVAQGLSTDTMMHESTHLLLDQAVSSPLAKVPAWLNEGLAMHFEAGARGRAPVVEQAARSNRLLRGPHGRDVRGGAHERPCIRVRRWRQDRRGRPQDLWPHSRGAGAAMEVGASWRDHAGAATGPGHRRHVHPDLRRCHFRHRRHSLALGLALAPRPTAAGRGGVGH